MASIQDVFTHAQQRHAAGHFAEAAALARVVLRLAPDHAVTRHMLGTALCTSGHGEEGLAHIGTAMLLDPGQPVYAVNLAILLHSLGLKPMRPSIAPCGCGRAMPGCSTGWEAA